MARRPATVAELYEVGLENVGPVYITYYGGEQQVLKVLDIRRSDGAEDMYVLHVLRPRPFRGVVVARHGEVEVLYKVKG